MTPHVWVDVDGVLADFQTPIYEIATRLFGPQPDMKEQNVYEIGDYLGLSRDQYRQVWDVVKKPGFHNRLKPYPGAVEGLDELRTIADVHILTSPLYGHTWCFERWEWLMDHFKIPAGQITHSHAKERWYADACVDDKAITVERWTKLHPGKLGLLWHHPYSRGVNPLLPRVFSWRDVIEAVAGI